MTDAFMNTEIRNRQGAQDARDAYIKGLNSVIGLETFKNMTLRNARDLLKLCDRVTYHCGELMVSPLNMKELMGRFIELFNDSHEANDQLPWHPYNVGTGRATSFLVEYEY